MKFSQMLDNIDYALGEDSFRSKSLFMCIGLVILSIVTAIIIGLLRYPLAVVPVTVAAIIGRIVYAAIKGK